MGNLIISINKTEKTLKKFPNITKHNNGKRNNYESLDKHWLGSS
jgi:hypothetical protein